MMSILEEVLLEEYARICRIEESLMEEIKSLPKGYISVKTINGKPYQYLQFRDNDKVKSIYVKKDEAEELKDKLLQRKKNEAALKHLKKSKLQIVKALGRKLTINEVEAVTEQAIDANLDNANQKQYT